MRLPTLNVFVSSTWHDLKPEREAVKEALNRLRSTKFIGMEYFDSSDKSPLHVALEWVRASDIYVGIIAGRYGSGITEKEYRMARRKRKPCFIFLKDKDSVPFEVDEEPEKREKLAAFKEKLRKHTFTRFTSPDNLAAKLTATLSNWYAYEYLPQQAEAGHPPGFAPYQLPPPRSDFVGRQQEIEFLAKALEPQNQARIALIHGMGGVGKTQLALQVAERLRAEYPHAQLLLELRGTREASPDLIKVLLECIQALGGSVPEGLAGPGNLKQLINIYRSNLTGKRALVVIDDAADEAQVEPFIPPSGCALLITSRRELSPPDHKVEPLRLSHLHAPEARDLLMGLAPRLGAETSDTIAHLCGYLPLALRAAGGLLSYIPDPDLPRHVARFRDERTRLKAFRVKSVVEGEEDERSIGVEIDVEASFNLSYECLKADAKRVFRHLAIFPASFDAEAEEVVCQDDSHQNLLGLVQLNLVMCDGKTGRYHLHDLARVYADERLSGDERDAARQIHARYFFDVAQKIEHFYRQGPEESRKGLEIFNAEWENLRAGQAWSEQHAATEDMAAALCIGYAEALQAQLYLRRPQGVLIKWLKAAVAAVKRPDAEGRLLCSLGTAYALSKPQCAIVDYYLPALQIAREIHDQVGEATALGNLGNVYARLGQITQAIEAYELCRSILDKLGNKRDAGRTLTNLGKAYAKLGDSARALKFYHQALKAARKVGDRRGEAIALSKLGEEHARSGKFAPAIKRYEQALKIMDEVDDLRDRIAVLTGLGNAYSAQHEHDRAIEHHQAALAISSELGDSSGEGIALGNLGNEFAEPRNLDQAIEFHEQALAISQRLGERENEVQDLGNLGHAYYLKGKIDIAIGYHEEALRLSREIDNPIYRGMTLWNLAQASDKTDNTAITKTYAEAALGIFEQLNHPLAADVRKFLFGRM